MFEKLTEEQKEIVLEYLPQTIDMVRKYAPAGEEWFDELKAEAEYALVLAVYYWGPELGITLPHYIKTNVMHALKWSKTHKYCAL